MCWRIKCATNVTVYDAMEVLLLSSVLMSIVYNITVNNAGISFMLEVRTSKNPQKINKPKGRYK